MSNLPSDAITVSLILSQISIMFVSIRKQVVWYSIVWIKHCISNIPAKSVKLKCNKNVLLSFFTLYPHLSTFPDSPTIKTWTRNGNTNQPIKPFLVKLKVYNNILKTCTHSLEDFVKSSKCSNILYCKNKNKKFKN